MSSPRPSSGPVDPVLDADRNRVVRGLLATAGLTVANVVAGRVLSRSDRLRERETAVIRGLQAHRTPGRDRLARVVSTASDVPASVLHGLVAVALVWRRTRDAELAAAPAVALVLQTVVYLGAGALVNRDRPDVPRLDREQPTSSVPSGHQGANVALMVVYLRLAGRVRNPWLRGVATALCLAFPATLAWARVHTGLHYASDVVAGTLNGVATGLVAVAGTGPVRSA